MRDGSASERANELLRARRGASSRSRSRRDAHCGRKRRERKKAHLSRPGPSSLTGAGSRSGCSWRRSWRASGPPSGSGGGEGVRDEVGRRGGGSEASVGLEKAESREAGGATHGELHNLLPARIVLLVSYPYFDSARRERRESGALKVEALRALDLLVLPARSFSSASARAPPRRAKRRERGRTCTAARRPCSC